MSKFSHEYLIAVLLYAVISASASLAQTPTPAGEPSTKPALKLASPKGESTPASRPKRPAPTKRELGQPWPASELQISAQDGIDEERARQLFQTAKTLLTQRKPEEALVPLREAGKLAPTRFEIQVLLGIANGILSRKTESASAFEKAVKLEPRDADVRSMYCRALVIEKKHIQAVDECREGLRLDPANTRIRSQLAEIYLVENRPAEAAQLLEAINRRPQDDIFYLGTLADAYFMSGEYLRAAGIYETIAVTWPSISVTYIRLSEVYDYLDRPNDSIAAARKFVDLEPRFFVAQFNLGAKLKSAGYFDESIEVLKKAIAIDSTVGEVHFVLSDNYEAIGDKDNMLASLRLAYRYLPRTASMASQFGFTLSVNRRYAEAIEPLELANSLKPNNPDILRSLGFAYIGVKRYIEGADLIERSIQLSPLPPGTTINVQGFRARQQIADRLEEFKAAVEKDPTDMRARSQLVQAYNYRGMVEQAEQQYLEVLKQQPTYQNYNYLSIFYQENGENEKALDAIRKAIALNPHHVMYMSMSTLLADLGRLDEAIAAGRRSVEIKSTLLESRLALGDLLLRKGDRNEALREFQAGFDLAPGDARPNIKLAWLYIRMGNRDGAFRHYAILRGLAPNDLAAMERSLLGHFGRLPL
ncbi:MAG: tetratricopeptide repeat protein [Pyrinomonadaceae bacterium]